MFKLRGGLDAQGKLTALEYDARAVDYNHLGYNEPDTVLIAQLMGSRRERRPRATPRRRRCKYGIPNRRLAAHVVALPMIWETPLRTGNLRDPNGPQVTFAFEVFIDELAAAARKDPAQFRLELIEASTEDDVSSAKRARSPCVRAARRQVRLGRAAVAETASRRHDRHRTRHRLHVPQQHRRRRDRRRRGQSRHRRRLGQALRLRARLRARDQPRGPEATPSSAACCTA